MPDLVGDLAPRPASPDLRGLVRRRSVVVSSQDSGRTAASSIATDAASVTACTLTPIWQFPTLPSVPEYIRATPGESDAVLREAAVVDDVGLRVDDIIGPPGHVASEPRHDPTSRT